MKFGYNRGHVEGFQAAADIYERQLAIVREELATAQFALANQTLRADAAADILLQHLGARAISNAGTQREEQSTRSTAHLFERMSLDPTDDQPLGTPGTEYADANAARIEGLDIVREPEDC